MQFTLLTILFHGRCLVIAPQGSWYPIHKGVISHYNITALCWMSDQSRYVLHLKICCQYCFNTSTWMELKSCPYPINGIRTVFLKGLEPNYLPKSLLSNDMKKAVGQLVVILQRSNKWRSTLQIALAHYLKYKQTYLNYREESKWSKWNVFLNVCRDLFISSDTSFQWYA